MGQQQFILLVLGVVIVGLAVTIGLQLYGLNQKKANADALLLTAMDIATDTQVWLRTPLSMGGGLPATGGVPNISTISIDLSDLGYTVNGSNEYVTVDGTYTLTLSGGSIFIEGKSVTTSGGGDNNIVCVEIDGASLNDLTTEVNSGSGTCG